MKVLIAGAGIGGPATAIALGKAGISARLYEAYPEDAADAGAFVTVGRIVRAGSGTGNPAPPASPSAPRSGNPTEWLFGHHIDWHEMAGAR